MVKRQHLELLRQGITAWNQWRKDNPDIQPNLSEVDLRQADLSGADLSGADLWGARFSGARTRRAHLSKAPLRKVNRKWASLSGANLSSSRLRGARLSGVDLSGANLSGADLWGADLSEADLSGADLSGADLSEADLRDADMSNANLSNAVLIGANLIRSNLSNATLTYCRIYGISAWDVQLEGATQSDLIITPYSEPTISVDNLKVAQFIYLLLNNQEIRDVIDTIGQKGVLILCRFSQERKLVLDALREKLRTLNFLPIVFDFERPTERDFTETIMTLAGLSCFIIADITNPKSSPLELQATVPNYMIPFVPIIQEGEQPFSMFRDLKSKYNDWVLDLLVYDTSSHLIEGLERAVISPALEKRDELMAKKVEKLRMRYIGDYL